MTILGGTIISLCYVDIITLIGCVADDMNNTNIGFELFKMNNSSRI